MLILDLKQRELVLDTRKSFIVQAPAGSGKTSLLVQRFLALLAKAETPDEIVAITFTKKAAAEIKDRVIDAIATALALNANDQYRATTSALAKKAEQRNQEKNWHLLENPNRLRIQTIDSLSYSIVKQVPILAQLGATDILENQALETAYLNAVTALFAHPILALKNLLLHLNNDLNKTEKLLIALLKKREQWLPYMVATKNNPEQLKIYLEKTLLTIVNENIEKCKILLAPQLAEILDLVNFARDNLQLVDFIDNNFCMVLEHWEFIAKMLLTKEFTWRKNIDTRNGFPAASTTQIKAEKILRRQKKEQIKTLLEDLQTNEVIRQNLENILHSPATAYSNSEWNIILSLCELLPLLVAELKLIFHEQQAVDYAEILMSADYALGTNDNPSELALNLDYKIQHLLIDEFQDTSLVQYRLIEKLITGWQEDDGRTLFLVGDPMQSIYRFRQAEVGLFLRAQTEKIGSLKLEPIILTTNFRSIQSIIDWVNANFQKIFPHTSDINYGAIPFTPSIAAANAISHENSVQIQLLNDGTPAAEAAQIISSIKKIHSKNPNETIAILARSRTHLNAILPALNQAQLNYQAVELANLSENPIIQDFLALTRALLDLTDRIAWLAILRAPWCGLNLSDLHTIANAENSLIIENLRTHETLNLSSDGKTRLAKFVPIILPNLDHAQRQNLSRLIEDTWQALAGPACINADEIETAELFFKLLRNNEHGGSIDLPFLERSLDSLFAQTTNGVTTLQVMTIHKAKGLEFDHVIIPGINHQLKNDDHPLLLWAEYIKSHQGNNLLLAPLTSNPNTVNKTYAYLWHLEQQKNKYETGRLLYVAMTRAKKSVYLTGTITNHANKNDNKINGLSESSLLYQLALSFNESWIIPSITTAESSAKLTEIELERLPANFIFPKIPKIIATKIPFQPLDDKASVGTIIHKYLEKISAEGLDKWTDAYILTQQENFKRELISQGCIEIEKYLPIVIQALCNSINDQRGRWILSAHENANNEYHLTAILNGETKHLVIDRTFFDDGKIWIVDYKTATPSGDLNSFLEQQKTIYHEQLEEYATTLQFLNKNSSIHWGLYFPLCRGWIEWIKKF